MAKRIIGELTLSHIAAVDNPCQEGARAKLTKRELSTEQIGVQKARSAMTEIAKIAIPPVKGFMEIMAENELWERRSKANNALWPFMDALRDSLAGIAADITMGESEKLTAAAESVTQFVNTLRAKWPDVAQEIDETADGMADSDDVAGLIQAGIVGKGVSKMDELEKIKAEKAALEAKVAELTGQMTAANAAKAAADAKAAAACADKETMTEQIAGMKKQLDEAVAKADETVKIAGTDQVVKRSEVGAVSFDIIKAQEARVVKAEAEKRAEAEFGHVPGTMAEKGSLIAHMATAPEDVRKTFETIISTAEKIAKGAFDTLGAKGDGTAFAAPSVQKARQDFMGKVSEIMGRDKCSKMVAMEKAEREFPDVFKAYREGDAAASAN